MPTCPIDGCGSPHDTWGGVAVHIWKTQADDHDMAESKDGALVWLAQNGYMAGDTSPSDISPDTSTESPDDTATDMSPEPATSDGGAVTFPENPDADDPDPAAVDDPNPDPLACPACGSTDVVDTDRSLTEIPNLQDRHRTALKTHDRHCINCGEVFDL